MPRVPVGHDGLHELPMTPIRDAWETSALNSSSCSPPTNGCAGASSGSAGFWISPKTIIPGAIAVGVGNVFYKERAVNLVTICAAYLGILGYLMLGHIDNDWPEQVRLYMGWAQSSRSSCSVNATQCSDISWSS